MDSTDQTTKVKQMENGVCTTCGGPTSGYKCTKCGESLPNDDPNHVCGVGLCQRHCTGCDKVESQCLCIPKVPDNPVSAPPAV